MSNKILRVFLFLLVATWSASANSLAPGAGAGAGAGARPRSRPLPDGPLTRVLRQAAPAGHDQAKLDSDTNTDMDMDTGSSNAAESEEDADASGAVISPVEILGLVSLVCLIIYCIGIGYKIFRIMKGTYVEEEPVFLKYK